MHTEPIDCRSLIYALLLFASADEMCHDPSKYNTLSSDGVKAVFVGNHSCSESKRFLIDLGLR